jgi:hypothetical protein
VVFILDPLLKEVVALPDEYHGVPAYLIAGKNPRQKAKSIYQAAKVRGLKVTMHFERASTTKDASHDDLVLIQFLSRINNE